MLLTEWARNRGRGAYRELELATGLNNRTVFKAARDGIGVTYECAEKLSNATRPVPNDESSGEPACSIDEIRYPERHATKRATERRRRAAS